MGEAGDSDDDILDSEEDDMTDDRRSETAASAEEARDWDIHDLDQAGEDDLSEVRAGYVEPGDTDGDPEVDPDDFIDDAEPDDFVDQGDTPAHLEPENDEVLDSGDALDSDVTAIDTGEVDPVLEAELENVDEDLAAKEEEDDR